MEFSQFVKNLRYQKKLSQKELAIILKVSFATINRWENLHASPSNLAFNNLLDYCKKNNIITDDIDEIIIERKKNDK
jgi:transcriptional regulator with XRE-family HTH domain